jgi:hypothetical protein
MTVLREGLKQSNESLFFLAIAYSVFTIRSSLYSFLMFSSYNSLLLLAYLLTLVSFAPCSFCLSSHFLSAMHFMCVLTSQFPPYIYSSLSLSSFPSLSLYSLFIPSLTLNPFACLFLSPYIALSSYLLSPIF